MYLVGNREARLASFSVSSDSCDGLSRNRTFLDAVIESFPLMLDDFAGGCGLSPSALVLVCARAKSLFNDGSLGDVRVSEGVDESPWN